MAQATRAELIKKQQQQVSTTSSKTRVAKSAKLSDSTQTGAVSAIATTALTPATSTCNDTNTNTNTNTSTSTSTSASAGANKTKPSYKHIPHSQKPPHLVAKRNARERRRVQAVNQAFYKLRKCVPIQNRNKRVSKVKTLQRAIDYIRDLEAVLAEDEAAQAGGNQATSGGRIFVSSQAGDEAEMRLAISPEPSKQRLTKGGCGPPKAAANSPTKQVSTSSSQPARPRRGRRPNASKQQESAATALKHESPAGRVPLTTAPRAILAPHQQQHYPIEAQRRPGSQASHPGQLAAFESRLPAQVGGEGAEAHCYGPPAQSTCHTDAAIIGAATTPAYAYPSGTHNQQYQAAYANDHQPHYYQPFHDQYHHQQQQQQQSYSNHQQQFYSPVHQVPYGDADSSSHQLHGDGATQPQQQPQQHGWQEPVPCGSTAGSSGHETLAQLNSSPTSTNLTQLMCNLNSSASSSGSATSSSGNATSSCLYNGQQQLIGSSASRRVASMPADSTSSLSLSSSSTTSSSSSNNNNSNFSNSNNNSNSNSNSNNNNKPALSLIDSPYSTASSSSSFSSSSGVNNKSLDSNAPLNLKNDKSPASAGGRQVSNYANYPHVQAPYLYSEPAASQQQPDESGELIGQQQQQQRQSRKSPANHQMGRTSGAAAPRQLVGFVCGGEPASELYLTNNLADEQQQQQQHHQQGHIHQQNYGHNSMGYHNHNLNHNHHQQQHHNHQSLARPFALNGSFAGDEDSNYDLHHNHSHDQHHHQHAHQHQHQHQHQHPHQNQNQHQHQQQQHQQAHLMASRQAAVYNAPTLL